ncbi:hypothetical protein ACTWP5_27720 [Streptomyces sp. 4N509B]
MADALAQAAAAAAQAAREAAELKAKALADLQRHGKAMAAITAPREEGRR